MAIILSVPTIDIVTNLYPLFSISSDFFSIAFAKSSTPVEHSTTTDLYTKY